MYSFLKFLTKVIMQIVNGNIQIKNKDQLPTGNYILVGPHRAWFDMILFALAASPKRFTFLAKKELFKHWALRFILKQVHAVPVDRDNPGPSVIKAPVKILKNTNLSIIIFPSGSRHSEDLKAGAILIAKLSNTPLVPVVYQGPSRFRTLFNRKPISITFGKSIFIDRKLKINGNNQAQLEAQLQSQFDQLDAETNPEFKYIDATKK